MERSQKDEIVKVTGTITEITKYKLIEEKLKQMAYYDELTDLPNRKFIQRHLTRTLARAKRHQLSFAVMFIDLDGFKNVNDTFGHDCGDQLLIEVANKLNNIVREEDLTGRLGGDEFIIVFEGTSEEELHLIAQRIIDLLGEVYLINGNEVKISPSIGVSIFPKDGDGIEELVKNADRAMYFAKNSGKNTFKFYHSEMESYQFNKLSMFEKIMNSVTDSELFQSIKRKF